MEKDHAYDLACFINERDPRFAAGVLAFGESGWVVVRDKHTERHLEPIADPRNYLQRAEDGVLPVDDTFRDLIREWHGV